MGMSKSKNSFCCKAFMQGQKQMSEKLFVSFQLGDRVPADNFYRRLKAELDLGFLYKSTSKYYGYRIYTL